MAIDSTINFAKPTTKGSYPYMGIVSHPDDGDLIVLFSARGEGTVLKAMKGTGYDVGVHRRGWIESEFAVCAFPVILKNV